MQYTLDGGEDYREYTRSFPGSPIILRIFLYGMLLVPLGLITATCIAAGTKFWPLSVTGVIAILLILNSMRDSPKHDRVLRVDKKQGVLTSIEKRPGRPDKLTHRVSIKNIVAVGTCCRPFNFSKGRNRGYGTSYAYGPVILLQCGTIVDTLAPLKGKVGDGLGNTTKVEVVNGQVQDLADWLGVPGTTVEKERTARVVCLDQNGQKKFTLEQGRVRLGDHTTLPSFQIGFQIVSVIVVLGLFVWIEDMRQDYLRDQKKAKQRAAYVPKVPVDNSHSGIIRQGNYLKILELLESDHFEANTKIGGGPTALQLVCKEDLNPNTAWVLLRHGASQNIKDEQGKTPADYLLERYLDPKSGLSPNQCKTLAILVEDGYKIPLEFNKLGLTPLHLFARDPNMDSTVEAMVEVQGVDINTPDKYGWTVLHHAVEARNEDLKLALIRLLKLGANPELKSKKDSGPALQRLDENPFKSYKILAGSTPLDLIEQSPNEDIAFAKTMLRERMSK